MISPLSSLYTLSLKGDGWISSYPPYRWQEPNYVFIIIMSL